MSIHTPSTCCSRVFSACGPWGRSASQSVSRSVSRSVYTLGSQSLLQSVSQPVRPSDPHARTLIHLHSHTHTHTRRVQCAACAQGAVVGCGPPPPTRPAVCCGAVPSEGRPRSRRAGRRPCVDCRSVPGSRGVLCLGRDARVRLGLSVSRGGSRPGLPGSGRGPRTGLSEMRRRCCSFA
jgi:hypothetical protein